MEAVSEKIFCLKGVKRAMLRESDRDSLMAAYLASQIQHAAHDFGRGIAPQRFLAEVAGPQTPRSSRWLQAALATYSVGVELLHTYQLEYADAPPGKQPPDIPGAIITKIIDLPHGRRRRIGLVPRTWAPKVAAARDRKRAVNSRKDSQPLDQDGQSRLLSYLKAQVDRAVTDATRWRALRLRALVSAGLYLGLPRVGDALRLTWDQFWRLEDRGEAEVRNLVGANGVTRELPLPETARVWVLEFRRDGERAGSMPMGALFTISAESVTVIIQHLAQALAMPGLGWGCLAATYRARLSALGTHPDVLAYLFGEDHPVMSSTGARVLAPDRLALRRLVTALDDTAVSPAEWCKSEDA